MGMTIDEAKQSLSYYQKLFNSLNGDYRLSQVQASELSHSIGTALDIIRRYQKMERMIDMTEDEAEYLKYRFKQYLGSVSRAIQNKRLEKQEMGMTIDEHNKDNDVKPIEVTPQLSEADSKKIIEEASIKPNYKKVQKLRESRPVESS